MSTATPGVDVPSTSPVLVIQEVRQLLTERLELALQAINQAKKQDWSNKDSLGLIITKDNLLAMDTWTQRTDKTSSYKYSSILENIGNLNGLTVIVYQEQTGDDSTSCGLAFFHITRKRLSRISSRKLIEWLIPLDTKGSLRAVRLVCAERIIEKVERVARPF